MVLAACGSESQTPETGAGAKRKGFIQFLTWENGGFLFQRPPHIPAQACNSYRDSERRAFFHYPIILLAFGVLRSCPFIFLAFGVLSVRTSPMPSWPMGEDSLVLPVCGNNV